jgi:hypothetical protein
MSTNSRPKSLSGTEFLGGGVALASVALIALGSVHIVRPPSSLPAPKRYASVSIEPSETLAKSSIEQLAEAAETKRDVQSPDGGFGTADSIQIKHSDAGASVSPAMDRAAPSVAEWPARHRDGLDADLPGAFTDVMSGLPLSGPLRASRFADSQRHGTTELPGVRAEPSFVGRWADDLSRCRTSRKAPIMISTHAARTDRGECDFGFVVREAENRWRVTAICAAEGNFWRAHIALKLMEPNLTWSSERGTETYVRCGR